MLLKTFLLATCSHPSNQFVDKKRANTTFANQAFNKKTPSQDNYMYFLPPLIAHYQFLENVALRLI